LQRTVHERAGHAVRRPEHAAAGDDGEEITARWRR
jgi:hypothetical protein